MRSDPLSPPEHKAAYVRQMFGRIARRYDLMNRLMTLGRDRAWRRYTVNQIDCRLPIADCRLPAEVDGIRQSEIENPKSQIANRKSQIVLDVATGTGDLALELLRQQPDVQVVGLDFTPSMLALARQKATAISSTQYCSPLHLTAGDALRLPFPDGTFDAVVTGFALRNVTSIPDVFAEMARVTRPGGRLACLEIARPCLPVFRHLFTLYFYRLVPLLGAWITGQRSAYVYLPHSLTNFPAPDQIAAIMRQAGWSEVCYRRLMLGTVAVHVGTRDRKSGVEAILAAAPLGNSEC